jgi:hypothetical protein
VPHPADENAAREEFFRRLVYDFSPFWTEVAARCRKELADPTSRLAMDSASRRRLRHILSMEDTMPLQQRQMPRGPRYSRDQDPNDPENGPNNNMMDADTCKFLVERCLRGLDDEGREQFLDWIVNDLMQRDTIGNRNDNDNGNGGNLFVGGKDTGLPKPAADRGARSGMRGAAGDRRPPAQDRALQAFNAKSNSQSFNRRWGALVGHVRVS